MGAAMMVAPVCGLALDIRDNPYGEITNRNAFALKPPPPPPNPADNQPPPPLVDVYLTGISTLGGTKKVFLQVVDTKTKKAEFPSPLEEGKGDGRVEVVSIDPEKGEVVVKVDGNERNLDFVKNSPKPAAAGAPAGAPPNPLMPGFKLPTAIPLPGMPTAAGTAAALNQAVPGAVAGSGGSGVVVGGGAASLPAPGQAAAMSAMGATPGISALVPSRPMRTGMEAGGVYVGGGAVAGGTPTMANPQAAQTQPAVSHGMTRDQVFQHVEEQRALVSEAERLGLVRRGAMPPLPPMPGAGAGAVPAPAPNQP
jgi:hypothetical protein